jgi:tetratricopeptide (TPR) repeat protein
MVWPVIMMACSGKSNPHNSLIPENRKGLEKQYYVAEGLKYCELQDLPMASAFFRQALRADSTCDACYYKLAGIYLQSGLPTEAAALCRMALQLDSTNIWYRVLLGKAYAADMNIDKAIAVFEAANRRNPNLPEARYQLASL